MTNSPTNSSSFLVFKIFQFWTRNCANIWDVMKLRENLPIFKTSFEAQLLFIFFLCVFFGSRHCWAKSSGERDCQCSLNRVYSLNGVWKWVKYEKGIWSSFIKSSISLNPGSNKLSLGCTIKEIILLMFSNVAQKLKNYHKIMWHWVIADDLTHGFILYFVKENGICYAENFLHAKNKCILFLEIIKYLQTSHVTFQMYFTKWFFPEPIQRFQQVKTFF